jgi:hypothetical protein
MRNMMATVLVSLLLFSGICRADGLPAAAQQEIAHLFSYLEHSGCQFDRNGSLHDAAEAVDHLNTKYQYLLRKDMISSAEDFIAGAATKSSMSGQAYLVRCADAAPVESAAWFQAELARYRSSLLNPAPKAPGKPEVARSR